MFSVTLASSNVGNVNNSSLINSARQNSKPLTISLIHLLISTSCALMILGTQCHHSALAKPDSRRNGARNLVTMAPTTTTASVSISPVELPDFEEPIGNHTVALGRDAQLNCKINNLGNFRTAWLRVEDKGILTIHNNVITRNYRVGLNNDDHNKNFILTIKNVQPSDKGGYMCQINSVPMKYAIGYLDVLLPPVFEDTASSSDGASPAGLVTVAEGGSANLSCRAAGHPQPVISWRREDNEPIHLNGAQSDEGHLKVESGSLALSSVSRLQSGAYLCIASNGVQPSASKRHLLDVQFGPIIRLPQTEVGAQLNQQSVKLNCYVELNPAGSYHWIKLPNAQGQARGRTGSEDLPSAGSEPIESNQDDQSLIERGDELTNSDKYEIVIKQQPSQQQQTTQSASGGGEKIQMVLNIRHVERQDFAWYKCIAKNSFGIQSSNVKLYESSSFSLDSMFRGSGGELADQQRPQQQQLGDSSSGRQTGSRPILSTRAHTRSSWIQRGGPSTSQSNSLRPHESSSSADSSWPVTNYRFSI